MLIAFPRKPFGFGMEAIQEILASIIQKNILQYHYAATLFIATELTTISSITECS
jgi:hypothetical protein